MNKVKINLCALLLFLLGGSVIAQTEKVESDTAKENYPTALVNFDDYKDLMAVVESHRADRLVSLKSFLKMSQEENTVILDTRSKYRYDRKHIKGAIHLAFTEFTQANLRKIIPNKKTRILIYCNNNFIGDQVDFASKSGPPNLRRDVEFTKNRTATMLALNISTYLNLFGYGYENVYELHELVHVADPKIEFEGTHTSGDLTIRSLKKAKKKK